MTTSQKIGFALLALLVLAILIALHWMGHDEAMAGFGLGVAMIAITVGNCYMGRHATLYTGDRFLNKRKAGLPD